jgi:hypothetical protein
VTTQRDLPIGDRDEPSEEPRAGELPSAFVERLAGQDYTPAAPAPACVCKARGWVCQHEPSPEERLDAIFRKAQREAGEEG